MNEDKARRYHRLKRQAGIASLLWGGGLLLTLLASGLTLRIRTTAESIAPGSPGSVSAWIVGVLVYVTLLSALNEAGSLPIAFYSGFLLERRYGLGTERVSTWLLDHAKSFALGVLLTSGAALVLYAVIAWLPDEWWLVAGLVFALLIVALTNVAPVLVLPLFYRVRPLDRESLQNRLLTLADRAGARVLGAYEWGRRKRKGPTRRWLVSVPPAGFSCRTRCSPSIRRRRSKSSLRTSSPITCTETSGRGSSSRAD